MNVPADSPVRLIHAASGMEFPLSASFETTIGHKDPITGIYPDIDLAPLDPQHSVSRRHARIYRRGSIFFLGAEIGTMNNATFVNGTKLDTGVPAQVHTGDKLRFGVVELQFEVP